MRTQAFYHGACLENPMLLDSHRQVTSLYQFRSLAQHEPSNQLGDEEKTHEASDPAGVHSKL